MRITELIDTDAGRSRGEKMHEHDHSDQETVCGISLKVVYGEKRSPVQFIEEKDLPTMRHLSTNDIQLRGREIRPTNVTASKESGSDLCYHEKEEDEDNSENEKTVTRLVDLNLSAILDDLLHQFLQ